MAEPDESDSLPTEPALAGGGGAPEPRMPAKVSDSGFERLLGAALPHSQRWQPPSAEDLQRSFPQFEIREIIGRGGMGAVYQGWQKSLERFVAIKILPPQAAENHVEFTSRFKREAKSMARLKHPGIVAVYDAGETAEGLLFFVMEYVEGTDVQKLIAAEGRLSPARALEITVRVCDALAYAHEHGIIHRDVKPSNIIIENDGAVKVADFGLAKATAQDTTMLTSANVAMGTPDFMAPEALHDTGQVDQRADVYAVGVMLYQMLTGKLPRGRFEPPSIATPGLDKRLDQIVDRALQGNRDARYSSATDLRAALQPVATRTATRSGAATGATKSSRQRWGIAGVMTLLVGIGGGSLLLPRSTLHPKVPSNPGADTASHQPASPETNPAADPRAIRLWDTIDKMPPEQRHTWSNGIIDFQGPELRFTEKPSRDGLLRAAILMNRDTDVPQLHLRAAGGNYYRLSFNSRAGINLETVQRNVATGLGQWSLPRTYGADEWAVFELRAIGDDVTVSVDGHALGSVHDPSQSQAGGVAIWAGSNGRSYFREIVYVPLDQPLRSAEADKQR